MRKKFKRLLCGLIACAMISASGAAVTAAENTAAEASVAAEATAAPETSAEPEATAAAEATAEPETSAEPEEDGASDSKVDSEDVEKLEETEAPAEPTPEPTPAPGKYENDDYYKKALTLCTSLGIIQGYEDGSVQPESNVTRAEMSAIVLRLINLKTTTTYRNMFMDVTSAHWAADTIQTVSDEGIVNGLGDGTFNPDGDVLYEQAVKMLVCAMNYENEAVYLGGYPDGYLAVATNNLSLLDDVRGTIGQAADRGTIIKLAYNALIGPYNEISTYDNGSPVYNSDKTLAKAKFDVIEEKGLLTGTHTTSLTNIEPAEGQVIIDGETYTCAIENVDDYLAHKITFYYVDDNKKDPDIIAILTDIGKTVTAEIDVDDIDTITDLTSSNGTIKTYSGKNYRTNNAYIVYNGDMIDASMYQAAVAADTDGRFDKRDYRGVSTGEKMTYEEFLNPDSGEIKLVDNDNDGKYDVLFITASETLLITAATDKKVTGKINNQSVSIDVDNEAQDKTITVIKEGGEAKTKNLKKNDVASFTRNLDEDILTFETTGESVTGKLASLAAGNDEDPATASINGDEYVVDANAYDDCISGVEATFYFDKYGRIGYVSSDTVISSAEKYGWLTTAYLDDSGDDYLVKIYTQDGKMEIFELADSVSYWAPKATEAESCSKKEMQDIFKDIMYNTVSVGGQSVDVRLVKYSTNTSNKITKLYCATTAIDGYKKDTYYSKADQTYDKKALTVTGSNLRGSVSTGNLLGSKYYMSDNMLEITVPNENSQMSNASNYSVAKVQASAYLDKENGVGKDFIVGEFSDDKQTYPTIVIRFVGASTNAAVSTDYGTADNNPTMVVKKILMGIDDDEETVYTLVGYTNGGEVRYTTKQNTVLAKVSGLFSAKVKDGGRQYEAYELWDAVDGTTEDGEKLYPGAEELTDFIGVGDVIGIAENGKILMMMVDASELVEGVREDAIPTLYNSQNPGISSSRDCIYIGPVSDSDMGEFAVMSVAGYKCMFDNTRSMDTVTISADGTITLSAEDASTIADVMDYDARYKVGDFAFARYANKGNLQEIVIFRFED